MSNAPFCPISNSQPTQKPRQPAGVDVASIPPAHDLRTAINAINQMNSVVQKITRGVPQVNNVYPLTAGGVPSPAGETPQAPQYLPLAWMEIARGYRDDKVVNPDDTSQSVEIKTLAFVEFEETSTGHRLIYRGQR